MDFKDPLFEGTFLRRYKRFFADIKYKGETIVAHVPNTGSMKGLIESERPCKFTFVDDPKRTLKYTLQMVKDESSWVGVNTHLPNAIVAEAFEEKLIAHWHAYTKCQREVKISDESRIDLVLSNDTSTHYVEVKNVTLADTEKNLALFPDAKTERGRKHLHELEKLMDQGHTAEMLFLVQRTDCKTFSPAHDIDPAYAKVLKEVMRAGVLVSVYPVDFLENGIKLRPHKIAAEFAD
jgi:sugar fermentation stimulation protein A